MHVLHTAELPPNQGRIIFAMTGCTSNRRKADKKIVTE